MWSSLAKADTDEYQTDVYGDELTSAESMAQGVIAGNVRCNEPELNLAQHSVRPDRPPGVAAQSLDRPSTLSDVPQNDELFRRAASPERPLEPESYIPSEARTWVPAIFLCRLRLDACSQGLGPEAGPPRRSANPLTVGTLRGTTVGDR